MVQVYAFLKSWPKDKFLELSVLGGGVNVASNDLTFAYFWRSILMVNFLYKRSSNFYPELHRSNKQCICPWYLSMLAIV